MRSDGRELKRFWQYWHVSLSTPPFSTVCGDDGVAAKCDIIAAVAVSDTSVVVAGAILYGSITVSADFMPILYVLYSALNYIVNPSENSGRIFGHLIQIVAG
jgi:hypothetical protein